MISFTYHNYYFMTFGGHILHSIINHTELKNLILLQSVLLRLPTTLIRKITLPILRDEPYRIILM